jgi:hypothetical protein
MYLCGPLQEEVAITQPSSPMPHPLSLPGRAVAAPEQLRINNVSETDDSWKRERPSTTSTGLLEERTVGGKVLGAPEVAHEVLAVEPENAGGPAPQVQSLDQDVAGSVRSCLFADPVFLACTYRRSTPTRRRPSRDRRGPRLPHRSQ